METITLHVPGMSCSHCENTIKGAVRKLDGVKDVVIDLTGKTVKVRYNPGTLSADRIRDTIEDQGYEIPGGK